MYESLLEKKGVKNILKYFSVILLCFIILLMLNIWSTNIKYPFVYKNDGLVGLSFIKSIVENGWYLENPSLASPYVMNFYYNITGDNMHFFIIKFLSIFSNNPFLLLNLYYILCFFMTTVITFYVFSRFKIKYVFALFGSMIFTFLPIIFIRGEIQMVLSAYYPIPLITMLILFIGSEDFRIFGRNENNKIKLLFNKDLFISIFICSMIAMSFVYYSFFACFFIIVSCLYSIFNSKRSKKKIVLTGFVLILMILIVIFINYIPNIIYFSDHGFNIGLLKKPPITSETYSLRISEMLLPLTDHRLKVFSEFKKSYSSLYSPKFPDASSLGIFTSIGFLFLLFLLLLKKDTIEKLFEEKNYEIITKLKVLNISGTILGLVGGFGTFFAMFFPYIRSYNRIVIFLAFFSVFFMTIFLNTIYNKLKNRKTKVIFILFLFVILFFAIADQSPKNPPWQNSQIKNEVIQDYGFINEIELLLPKGANILCLPRTTDYYKFLRMYLNSKDLKWNQKVTYGFVENNQIDKISNKPLNEMIPELKKLNFSGIVIDKSAFNDTRYVDGLRTMTNKEPLIENDLYFFDIRNISI